MRNLSCRLFSIAFLFPTLTAFAENTICFDQLNFLPDNYDNTETIKYNIANATVGEVYINRDMTSSFVLSCAILMIDENQNSVSKHETPLKVNFVGELNQEWLFQQDARLLLIYDEKWNLLQICRYHDEILINIYQKAAKGDAQAQASLGSFFLRRKNDKNKAQEWYEKAATQNNPWALYALGCMHKETGDLQKAFSYLKKAAELENPYGEYALGYAYEEGDGCEKNLTEAIKWYSKSSNQGFGIAKQALRRILVITTDSAPAD